MDDAAIVQQVVEQLQQEFGDDLLGVLAGGSRQCGEGDTNSDIDLVVLIAQPRRRRQNIVIAGVEVEMLLNPVFQIHRYFTEERNSGRGLMQHLLSTGQIVYDLYQELANLQALARRLWAVGPAPASATQQWQMRYAHADGLRDIADVVDRDDDQAAYLIGKLLPQIINDHYRLAGRWLHKPKRIFNDLLTWDIVAACLARQSCEGSVIERYAAIKALSEHVLKPIGGLMPLAWQSEWENLEP
jgi:predicted nucleotidyltransferase